jgi:cell division protein FtsA
MTKSDIIASIDMGSGRVTCILAVHDQKTDSIKVLSGATLPCKGLKGGVVVDIPETANIIADVMEQAEEKIGDTVGEVFMGIRGYHIESFNNKGAYNIARTDKEISAEDVESVIETARAIKITPDREILHIVPQGFSLDKQKGVPNPVGMEGSLLEVNVHIVTAAVSHVNNLIKSVAQSGFRVAESVYNLLGVGEIVITPEEKDLGCLLVDIGGQTTSIGIYYDGSLQFSREIPLGGDYITRDIAYGLGTTIRAAKEIKEKHGAVLRAAVDDEETITVTALDGRTKKEIKPSDLLEYIQPRAEEIFSKIDHALQTSGLSDLCRSGAVLVGGSSLLKGMPEACQQYLELKQTRLGFPNPENIDSPEEYLNQTYFTAMGLVCYPYLKSCSSNRNIVGKGAILPSVTRWVKDLFSF